METKGDHSGHRQRVRDLFLQSGLRQMPDALALELLLFYAIPRRDVAPLARTLVEKFGSCAAVLQASVEELTAVEGVSEHTAVFLSAMAQASGLVAASIHRTGVHSPSEYYAEEIVRRFQGRPQETLLLLGLDAQGQIINVQQISQGNVCTAQITPRKVVAAAIAMGVDTVILAHNHPSGLCYPSVDDVNTTAVLQNALRAVDIALEDHFIVSGTQMLSVRDFVLEMM